jgi:hypothetical protein
MRALPIESDGANDHRFEMPGLAGRSVPAISDEVKLVIAVEAYKD